MALPPSRLHVAPPLTDEEKLAAAEAKHAREVAELERVLDASLAGKLATGQYAGKPVVLSLPIGMHTPCALDDIEAHYVAAGWTLATVEDGRYLMLVP